MDDLNYVLLASRWLHLAAAIVAIGGAAFMRFALIPAANAALTDEGHQKLREALRARWSKAVMICITVLLLTGFYNFFVLAVPPKVAAIPYHPIFGVKILTAFAVFFIASALVGRSPGTEKMRSERAKWLSRLLAFSAVIVLLSGVLMQIRTAPKPQTAPPAAPPTASQP